LLTPLQRALIPPPDLTQSPGWRSVAHKAGSPALLDQVRSAFVHGIGAMLWVSAALAVAGVVLALLFLPWRATAANTAAGAEHVLEGRESAHERAA